MKIIKIILVSLSLIFANNLLAQKSQVKIISDPSLDSLVKGNIEVNKISNSMDGYRIQIFSGTERKNANALKAKFKVDFPDQPSYIIYQQPYFKIRVGDFRTTVEAQKLYYELLKSYGEILIIPEKINYPKL